MTRALHVVILCWGIAYCIANYSEVKQGWFALLQDIRMRAD